MEKFLKIFFLPFLIFSFADIYSQKMSADQYWVSFTDKNQNDYSLEDPEKFLSQESINRRLRFDIPLVQEDLPVSSVYTDSLRSLGLKIVGSSKWFNACIVESTDSLLLDSLDQLDFVSDFSTEFSNFAKSEALGTQFNNLSFDEEFEYGSAYTQSSLLGGISLHQLGYKGEGIKIAVLDAGFYRVDSFYAFQSLWSNNQILGIRDFVNPEGNIFNESSHGMSVLSTMAVSDPGSFIGTAPDASYYLLRSEDAPRENKIEEAYWVLAAEYADSAGADIITSSLGYYAFDNSEMDYQWEDLDGNSALVTRAAEMAFSRGMIVIASAGNEGNNSWQKITPPADGINVLAIGSIDTSLQISSFSSKGYTEDGRIKPDVLAVGYQTKLIVSSGETGQGYGTSFAAPQIAGYTACLWQAMPEKTNLEIIESIRQSASMHLYPDSIYGYGVPNFMVALWYLSNLENENSNGIIKVYPNPYNEDFYILSPEDFQNLSIYNSKGSLLYSETGNWKKGDIIHVSPSGINQPGIYFLVTQNEENKIVSKLIRK